MLAILSIVLVEAQGDQSITATALERGIHCSPSSLLMLILMLWSIPVLIYAILFFPELKQSVRSRRGVHLSRKDERDDAGNEFASRIFAADDCGSSDSIDVEPADGGQLATVSHTNGRDGAADSAAWNASRTGEPATGESRPRRLVRL
jgi:hypothetical protein